MNHSNIQKVYKWAQGTTKTFLLNLLSLQKLYFYPAGSGLGLVTE